MISTRWLERRKPHWERLESLLDESRRHGIQGLSRNELRELSLLYRQSAADLSVLREDAASQPFTRYLNQLLARAHNTIYAGRKASASSAFHFFRDTYPQVFRDNLRFTAAAFLLFAGSALLGVILTTMRPDFMHHVLGARMVETIEQRKMWTESIVSIKPVASSGIMTNNLSVAFMTFASGISAGVGTVYMLVFNGLLLGVIGTACWLAGMSVPLWSFVAPHGVLELPAIFIAGGAGLRVAHGLLFPGVLTRRDSLAQAGTEAVRLLLGMIPMLVIAGVVEGFLSPSKITPATKFLFAGVMLALLVVWLLSRPKATAGSAP
jgi:uncharacterized membrane protein SpoIIM required for sporulation